MAVVLGAIALTLLLGPVLSDLLRDSGLPELAFTVGLLLVGAAVVSLAGGLRAVGVEVGVVLGLAAVGVLLITRVGFSADVRTHLVEYAVLAALLHAALVERTANGRRVRYPAITAAVTVVLIGVADECLQLLMPERVFDPLDIAFNTAAAITAVTLSVVVRWILARLTPRLR